MGREYLIVRDCEEKEGITLFWADLKLVTDSRWTTDYWSAFKMWEKNYADTMVKAVKGKNVRVVDHHEAGKLHEANLARLAEPESDDESITE